MNILDHAVADIATMHVKNADGAPLYDNGKPVCIRFYGPGSERHAEVEARQTARALKRREANDGKISVPTPDEARTETAEDLATLTDGFENLTYGDGNLTGSELFRAVYADRKLGFVARQAAAYVSNWGNFSAASVTS